MVQTQITLSEALKLKVFAKQISNIPKKFSTKNNNISLLKIKRVLKDGY